MAMIYDEIIKPKAIVERTIFHVFNWGKNDGSNNVDLIGLEFNDGSYISYATEMYLDLPNGEYELIDGNYVKISSDEDDAADNAAFEEGRQARLSYEMDIKIQELVEYIQYVMESADKYKIEAKELISCLNDLTKDTYDKVMLETERIACIINDKIGAILDSQSDNISTIKKYFSYLQGHTDKIFDKFSEMVTDTNFNFIKDQSEKFADNLEKMEKFIEDLKGDKQC